MIHNLITYQLAFVTPGNSPFDANSLKQILHTPNFLIKDLFLPQILQTLLERVLNFGFLLALTVFDVFAIYYFWKGIPNERRSAIPSWFVFALVTIVISRPCTLSNFDGSISGKTIGSENPNE